MSQKISTPDELAGEAAFVATMANRGLVRAAHLVQDLKVIAQEAAMAAAAHALDRSNQIGANAFDDPVVCKVTDMMNEIMWLSSQLEELILKHRPLEESVRANEALAERERGRITTH